MPASLESFMREALGDPRLRFLLWRWEEERLRRRCRTPRRTTRDEDVRTIEIADGGGRPKAAVVYDAALADSAELVDGLARTSLLILDNDRLVTEMTASQARIASATATERIRLERDLHDGAQQRLIGLKFELARIGEDAGPDWRSSSRRQCGTRTRRSTTCAPSATASIHRCSSKAGYLLPCAPWPAPHRSTYWSIDGDIGRSSAQIEYAVYLCALEAIQNAVKHGGPTVRVRIDLELTRPEPQLLDRRRRAGLYPRGFQPRTDTPAW